MMKKNLVLVFISSLLVLGCQSNQTLQDQPIEQKEVKLEKNRHANSPANVFIELSAAYVREGNLPIALNYAKVAVEKDASHPNAHNILALVYQRLKQMKSADKSFRKALSLSPTEPYINNAYATFLCEQGQFDRANKHYENTIRHPLYREKWIALSNAGVCELRAQRSDSAQAYFRKALQNNGKFTIALYNMIDLSVREKNFHSARAFLQRYLENAEHTSETLWWGIQTEKNLGDRDKLDSFKLLLRAKFPESDEAKLLEADETT